MTHPASSLSRTARPFRAPVGQGSATVREVLKSVDEIVASVEEGSVALRRTEKLGTRVARASAKADLTLVEFCAVAAMLRLVSYRERSAAGLALEQVRDRLVAASLVDWRQIDMTARHVVERAETAGKGCVHLTELPVASELGLQPHRVSALLGRELGLSFRELRRAIVMRRAVQMLASGSEHVAQIAYAVGYEHPSPFNRSFLNLFGISPRSYRRLVRFGQPR